MKQILISCCLTVCCGCGISLTTSGLKVGLMDHKVETDNAGNTVCSEETIGLSINWFPYFTYHDLMWWK